MTADVWKAVIQQRSPLRLLIRNSETGPVWLTDGWIGICALVPSHPYCHLLIQDISKGICHLFKRSTVKRLQTTQPRGINFFFFLSQLEGQTVKDHIRSKNK